MRTYFTLLLAFFFANNVQSQSITVNTPNGGEILYACQSYIISWNASGTSNFYDIDYSLNNGSTWASVASNLNVTNGQFSWTVPNAESNTCLIRVRDKNDNSKVDISDAVFSIRIPVTVTAPNGGEQWQGGSTKLITWNIQGTSLTFNLDYSTNGGSSWTPIVSNLSTSVGTYNWTVPNTPSTNCLVRVRDAVTNCMQDQSNAPFTITAAQPVLTYPNGGESFHWNELLAITWNASTFFTTVRLEYSLDNGVTWQLIAAAAPNNGSYSWQVPSNTGTQVLVKASNSSNVSINDVSNGVFTILRPLVITAPNGGESLLGCNSYTVRLTRSSFVGGTLFFEYSVNGGTSWLPITNFSNSGAAVTSFNWTVPNGISSGQCLVRGYNSSVAGMSDTSDAVFTIQPNNVITVTAPNGGEVIPALSSTVITWTNTAGSSGLYNVEYSSNNGNNWTTLATGISGNSYNWTNIPNVPSSFYLVRVSDNANTCRNDVSDGLFRVSAAQPVLTYPNGGESFHWNELLAITWNASTFFTTVRLEYSLDNGVTWQLIAAAAPNNGSYSWQVPSNTGTQVLVKASNSSNVSINDVSNGVFTILRPLVITAPNGGESLLGCNSYTVRLTRSSFVGGTLFFEYSVNGGTSWLPITNFSNSGAAVTSFNWTVPNGISSGQCLVRGYNSSVAGMSDTSDAVFTIQPNNVITVTAPNGGEVIPALSSTVITWTNTAGSSGLYNVEYSSNNGNNWTTLATGISGNSYNWTNIPNVPSSFYLVRVSDNANTCRNDVSDGLFRVSAAQPVLTYPNGGEQLWSSSTTNITWNASTFFTTVRLEYSLDNGVTWQLIAAAAPNNGSYSWTVPNSNSANCLVRASNSSNVSINDASNGVFTILPVVKLFNPNGLEQLGACTQTSITFAHTPVLTSYTIDYSVNNGVSWVNIVTNQSFPGTTGSYNWSIPNLPSTTALVRVYPGSNVSLGDQSDTIFTIRPSVTVVLPSYGGVLQSGSSYMIKWNSDGISNLYDIAYSVAGPTGPWTNIVLAYNTASNTYNWTVPNVPSENAYIRVRDNVNGCKEDVSDFAFAIRTTPAPLTIVAPNAADTLNGCQTYTINWTESGPPIGSYTIDWSANGGLSWSNVVTGYNTTGGSYNWVVPNVNTSKGLVRVSASNVSTIFDICDLGFVIRARSIKASPDTVVCSGVPVNLLAVGGVGNYSWSPSDFLSAANIANPVATPAGTIQYVVTSSNGSCMVRDSVRIVVQPAPVFSILADATNICGGQLVTFTARVVQGGSSPSFQWKLNGNNVGSNDSTFRVSTLRTGDTVSCVLGYSPACFAPVTSNKIGVFVNAKPNLGGDTTVSVSCNGCTVNLTALYNTSGYLYVSWNTPIPAAAQPGVYRLIVSQLNGCTCPDTDTAFVYVNAFTGLAVQTCVNGNASLTAAVTGSNYQWQVNTGSGFVDMVNNGNYAGVHERTLNMVGLPGSFYGYQYRCVVDGSPAAASTLSFAAYWSGNSNTDWENPSNWGCGAVPDRYTDVFIYGGKANYPEVNCNRVCRSIYAAPSTSLKVSSDKILLLTGKN